MSLLLSLASRPGGTQLYMHDADTGARVAKNSLTLPAAGCSIIWMKNLGGRVIVLSYTAAGDYTFYLSLLSEDRTSLSTKFTVTTPMETVELIYTDKYVLLAGNNVLSSNDLELWDLKYTPERSASRLTFGDGTYYMFGLPTGAEASHLRYRLTSSDLISWSTAQLQDPVVARFNGKNLIYNYSGVSVESPNAVAFVVYNPPSFSAQVDGTLYIGGSAGEIS